MKGICHFHSETGTEGGYWAFQDAEFMGIPNNSLVCKRCTRVWNVDLVEEEPKPSFSYLCVQHRTLGWQDDLDPSADYGEATNLMVLSRAYDSPQERPTNKFNESSNANAAACYHMGHLGWEPMYPEGTWSYDGLHVLKDGDYLKIFDKDDPSMIVWEGYIKNKFYEPFTQHFQGLNTHSDQEGVDREIWGTYFLSEYPAELTKHG